MARSRTSLSWIFSCSKAAYWVPSSQDFCNQQEDKSTDRNKDQLLPSGKVQDQIAIAKRVLRLMPNQTFNGSLGDYTQWVHLACPHWFDFPRHCLPSLSGRSKKTFVLRPPSTASSQQRSRGLHPVGALSMPPLDQYLTRHDLSNSSKRAT